MDFLKTIRSNLFFPKIGERMLELPVTSNLEDLDRFEPKTRDLVEIATAIMVYALKKNIGAFRFSGLRIPKIIQIWESGMDLPDVETLATEIAIFQEHLCERIAALANNRRMIKRMWELNEKTRDFREQELRRPKATRDILDNLAKLVNALFARDEDIAVKILLQCEERRTIFLEELRVSNSSTRDPQGRACS